MSRVMLYTAYIPIPLADSLFACALPRFSHRMIRPADRPSSTGHDTGMSVQTDGTLRTHDLGTGVSILLEPYASPTAALDGAV
jgi:hypothetical protein